MDRNAILKLEPISFIPTSEGLAAHCARRRDFLMRQLENGTTASIPLTDRFYFMSKGFLPIVSLQKSGIREKSVTIIDNTSMVKFTDGVSSLNNQSCKKREYGGDDDWENLGG